MAIYLWLTVKSQKQIMADFGFYDGPIDSLKNVGRNNAALKVNRKYLPKKFHKPVYYKETDIVLRNLKKFHDLEIKNFKLEEFKCSCGRKYCSGYPVVLSSQLLINLQELRDTIGKPITVMHAAGGGMRCEELNRRTPGAIKNSLHTKGRAADIQVANMTETLIGRQTVMNEWKRLPKHNYTYCNVNGSHPNMGSSVHVDVSK